MAVSFQEAVRQAEDEEGDTNVLTLRHKSAKELVRLTQYSLSIITIVTGTRRSRVCEVAEEPACRAISY